MPGKHAMSHDLDDTTTQLTNPKHETTTTTTQLMYNHMRNPHLNQHIKEN
uniref:Uncharacterized protein n=1 Tax=Arion vulgaris TaxID=1028688 RepID=A0A0B6YA52_9EUPU